METISQKEATLKEKCKDLEISIQIIIDEIDIHITYKNVANTEIDNNLEAIEVYKSSYVLLKNLEEERKIQSQLLKKYKKQL